MFNKITCFLFALLFSGSLLAQGLNDFPFKRACRAVATSNVASLSGTTTIDDVALVADNRVLLTGQSTGSENGLWVVKSGEWVRPVDFNDAADAKSAVFVAVEEGTVNANSMWLLGTDNPITIGTTALTFVKTYPTTGGVASITPGPGIDVDQTGADVTINNTGDLSATNEDLANNDQTLTASRTITNNGFDLDVVGSSFGSKFTSAGNVVLGGTVAYNRLHIINSGTSLLTSNTGRGTTITSNTANPPSVLFESPDLTDGSQVMGIQFVSNSGLGLWKLASFSDNGLSATVDNIWTATHAGNVGIGGVPVSKFHIQSNDSEVLRLTNSTTLHTTADGLGLGLSGASGYLFLKEMSASLPLTIGEGTSSNRFKVYSDKIMIGASAGSDIGDLCINWASAISDQITTTQANHNAAVMGSLNGSGYSLAFMNSNSGASGLLFRATNASANTVNNRLLNIENATTSVLLATGNGNVAINQRSANTNLDVNGGIGAAFAAKSADYTLVATDFHVNLQSGSSAATFTIPAAAAGNTRQIYVPSNSSSNTLTIAGGFTGSIATGGAAVQIQSSGSAWIKIN